MRYVFLIALISLFGCSLEEEAHPLEPAADKNSDKVLLGFDLSGVEYPTVGGANSREAGQEVYYGYDVYEIIDGNQIRYASGATNNLGEVELEFQKRFEYLVLVSSVTFKEKYDLSVARFFSFRLGVDQWPIFRYNSIGDTRQITREGHPFSTEVSFVRVDTGQVSHSRFESDKFIGRKQVFIDDSTEALEVEMLRMSSGLTFKGMNLNEGELHISVHHDVKLKLTPESNEAFDLRPYIQLSNYRENTFALIENPEIVNEMNYPVRVEYVLEDADGTSRKAVLLESELLVRRNYNLTYEIDLNDFEIDWEGNNETPPGEDGSVRPRLIYVDEELIEGETIRLN
ncbi:hypothetical protein KIH41_10025 [Litoribacter ruber]|uniref:hypothetical protein n=1 Tax=Litoribacter ruber TaxID=702568 RepID=UPI001BD94A4A|nr:hypothetical protein [Litoribacter ruber]MBT0811614.1 hypothetical protein [Litoribacter ruber]